MIVVAIHIAKKYSGADTPGSFLMWQLALGFGLSLLRGGISHVRELVALGNTAPDNAGGVMYIDLFHSLFLAALLIWYRI